MLSELPAEIRALVERQYKEARRRAIKLTSWEDGPASAWLSAACEAAQILRQVKASEMAQAA